MSKLALPSLHSIGLVVLALSSALGQTAAGRGGHPFEGEWTLAFDVATPPGGVTLTDMYGSNSPYHTVFHASKKSFQVQADGTFAWQETDDGALKISGTANYVGTHTLWWESHQPLLKAEGAATATPTPPGSPQPYERSLELSFDWSGGNGAYGDNHGGGGAYIVDAAGQQMTVTGVGGPTTLPVTWYQSKWSLKPTRTVREEISPDEIRETTIYAGSRRADLTTKVGKYKVTERVEVKHVRHPRLIPRG
jgi:hypothetical protein